MRRRDRDLMRRLLLSAHRCCIGDDNAYNEVVCWLLDNSNFLREEGDPVFWDIQFLAGGSLDDRIRNALERHGRNLDDIDAVRRRYHRYREAWNYLDPEFSNLLGEVFRHLFPPPAIGSPNEELRCNYTQSQLDDWYV